MTALAAVSVLAGGLLLWSAPALALNLHTFSHSFGESGSEAGQFDEPDGMAVNDRTHVLYVVDRGNNRVEEFTAAGAYVGQFNGSGTYEIEGKVEHGAAAPTGAFKEPSWIAVDDSGSPMDPSEEDVYVIDEGHDVIDKFNAEGAYLGQLTMGEKEPFDQLSGVAVDSAGRLWVSQEGYEIEHGYISEDGEVMSFSDGLVNEFISHSPREYLYHGRPGFAVNSEGRLYVTQSTSGQKISAPPAMYNKNYEFEGYIGKKGVTGIAVDTSNDEVFFNYANQVEAYGQNDVLHQVFGEGDLTSGSGIAVDPSSHIVYAADSATDKIDVFDRVIVPDPVTGTEPAEEEQEGSVTLEGTVNPDGEPVTSCEFEYGTEESYGKTASCAALPGSGSSPVAVQARISGLTPLTTYHYRLVAGNAHGTNPGADQAFIAPVHPTVNGESAEDIVVSAATLRAEVNPGGADTTYRFEYGPTTAYGMSVPMSGGAEAGARAEDESVYARTENLLPDTTYHFRVVLSSPADREVVGPDRQFTTQSEGGEFVLPDGRAWELVSPPNKHGAGLYGVGYYEGAVIQAAAGGSAFTWAASSPIEANPPGGRVGETTQVYSRRSAPGAWESLDIATPHTEGASTLAVGHSSEYKLFSEDLSVGLVEPAGHTPLPPLPAGSEKTIYLRDDATGAYQALVSAANVPPGTHFGHDEEAEGDLSLVAATPDLSHVVIGSKVGLTKGSPEEGGLYEWAEGKLQFVGVLPDGEQVTREVSLGYRDTNVRHAISNDGLRLVLEVNGHLYLRDMKSGAGGETVQVDAAQGAPEPASAGSVYQTASSDDSRIFFTSSERLTGNSTASGGEEDLYVFELTSGAGEPLAGKLTDLTVDANPGESASVQGEVIGASEDGSSVYFVADGVLGDGVERDARPGTCAEGSGTCNLYGEHYDAVTKTWGPPMFIASLSGEDQPDWNGQGGGRGQLQLMTSRVSPNGRYLAFMSDRSLTGYENRDADSGAPDEEVYLYDADSEHLVCASCNPTEAQPVGMFDRGFPEEPVVDPAQNWAHRWLAASIPGWTSESLAVAQYQSRYLSNSGRLFFDSADALVPDDVNGQEDVYEYEPAGIGSCQAPGYGQSASDVYSQIAGGCIGLISSGLSPEESAFMDASETGGDVFFMTSARLTPQAYETSYAVYDAHECTSAEPCAPAPPGQPPACDTEASCKAAPTPQPSIYGAPSSEIFSGVGDVASEAPPVTSKKVTRRTAGCKRGFTKKRGRCVRKSRPKRKSNATRRSKAKRAKRASNDRRARAEKASNDRRAGR